jgi:hypothetical protein
VLPRPDGAFVSGSLCSLGSFVTKLFRRGENLGSYFPDCRGVCGACDNGIELVADLALASQVGAVVAFEEQYSERSRPLYAAFELVISQG